MRRSLLVVAAAVCLGFAGGICLAQETGPDPMPKKVRKALEWKVGTWEWVLKEQDIHGQVEYAWSPGGDCLIGHAVGLPEGLVVYFTELSAWDGKSEDTVTTHMFTRAWNQSGTSRVVSDTVLEGADAGIRFGKSYSGKSREVREGEDRFVIYVSDQKLGGEPLPDETFVFTRARPDSDEQELIKLAHAWLEAEAKEDAEAMARLWADDLQYSSSAGTVETKSQALASIRSGDLQISDSVYDTLEARVYGDMGVTTGIASQKGQFKGRDISGKYRFTDTWLKRDGRWQCVATHASKIAEGTDEPATRIEGLWSMQERKFNGIPEDRENRKALKFYQDGTFLFVDWDISTGKVELVVGGDYALDGTTLIETLRFVNLNEYLPYCGLSVTDSIRFDDEIFHQSGNRMGEMLEEVWKRVTPK